MDRKEKEALTPHRKDKSFLFWINPYILPLDTIPFYTVQDLSGCVIGMPKLTSGIIKTIFKILTVHFVGVPFTRIFFI